MINRAVRLNRLINSHARRSAHRSTNEAVGRLTATLDRAGAAGPVPYTLRRAIWACAYSERRYWAFFLRSTVALAALAALSIGAVRFTRLLLTPAVPAVRTVFAVLDVTVFSVVIMLVLFSTLEGWNRTVGRFRPVKYIADAVNSCGSVLAAGPRNRADRLSEIPMELRFVEQQVLKMYRRRGTVNRLSHRRPQLRRHARLVAARLRRAEAGLDTDPQTAAIELIELMLTVADNYDAGRVGKLLPEEELADLLPVRDYLARALPTARTVVRLGLSSAVVTGAALGGGWIGDRYGVPPAIAAIPAVALAGMLLPAVASLVSPPPK